jgi:hypothetical protein
VNQPNTIFETHYQDYLKELAGIDLSTRRETLGVSLEDDGKTIVIPYFGSDCRASCDGVVNAQGERPDYGTCVVLLKYLLLCPQRLPLETDWVNYRDLKDSGPLAVYFNDNVINAISRRYSGRRNVLEAAAALGGGEPVADYPSDTAMVFKALPRVPMLLLFNDADDEFPAQTTVLFEKRVDRFLDAECLAMLAVALVNLLKQKVKELDMQKLRGTPA